MSKIKGSVEDASRGRVDHDNKSRLKRQLTIQKEAKQITKLPEVHQKQRRLDEIAFYPKHDPRLETPEYKKVHDKLTKELDRSCLICGVKRSTLNDPLKNLYGARQMETHHHVIEWALANAIDTKKFNLLLRPNLQHKHPETEIYKRDMTEKEISAWVDHSEDNLWVLCDVHHRSKYFGIHEISHPIWGPMDILRPDFEQFVRDTLKAAAQADGKKTKGTKKTKAKPSQK